MSARSASHQARHWRLDLRMIVSTTTMSQRTQRKAALQASQQLAWEAAHDDAAGSIPDTRQSLAESCDQRLKFGARDEDRRTTALEEWRLRRVKRKLVDLEVSRLLYHVRSPMLIIGPAAHKRTRPPLDGFPRLLSHQRSGYSTIIKQQSRGRSTKCRQTAKEEGRQA